MNKSYSRVDWGNYPSVAISMGDTNMHKLDAALDEEDNRVIAIGAIKTESEGNL